MSQPADTATDTVTVGPATAQDEFSSVSAEPTLPATVDSSVYDNTLMSFLAAMFLTICVFAILGIYCQAQKKKKYNPYEWNNNATFTAPFHLCQINSLRDVQREKVPILHPGRHTTINMFKADSKYPRIKRKFSYFVPIPEEEENDQESRKLQTKLFPTSFPR